MPGWWQHVKGEYGWLRKFMWGSGILLPPSGYDYGWPAGGSLEADVIHQWIFDEAATPIVDEVSALSVPEVGGGATYNVAVGGDWANLSPGITSNGGNEGFGPSAANMTDIGTSDFMIEIVFSSTHDSADKMFQDFYKDANNRSWIYPRPQLAVPVIEGRLRLGGVYTNWSYNVATADYIDGDPHKLRFLYDRDGNHELLIDGVSKGTTDISGNDGKNFADAKAYVSTYSALNIDCRGTMFEMRVSKNLTNNSGGPGGG